jgi:hypothetical protein
MDRWTLHACRGPIVTRLGARDFGQHLLTPKEILRQSVRAKQMSGGVVLVRMVLDIVPGIKELFDNPCVFLRQASDTEKRRPTIVFFKNLGNTLAKLRVRPIIESQGDQAFDARAAPHHSTKNANAGMKNCQA